MIFKSVWKCLFNFVVVKNENKYQMIKKLSVPNPNKKQNKPIFCQAICNSQIQKTSQQVPCYFSQPESTGFKLIN